MTPKVTEEYRERKRLELILAAKNVFEKKGFERTTLADIIDEAGISRGTIYLYFSSTEEIFEALLDYYEGQGSLNIDEYLSSYPSVWSALENFFEMQKLIIFNVEKGIVPAVYEYSLISWRDLKKKEKLVYRYRKSEVLLEKLIEQGIENNEFSPKVSIGNISYFITSHINGLTFNSLIEGVNEKKISDQIELFAQTIYFLLGKK